jgi:hypothetical protein
MDIMIKGAEHLDKRGLQESGADYARDLMAAGERDPLELIIAARKASEFLGSFIKEMDPHAREELLKYQGTRELEAGKLELGSTGDRPALEEDPVYQEINKKLKERADLLKLARKSSDPVFDSEGIEVPKVGLKTAAREVLKVSLK